jgi:L-cysteine desulfidase
MASNDSGDHGLTVILPQLLYSQEKNTSNLTMLRAIAFANLIT